MNFFKYKNHFKIHTPEYSRAAFIQAFSLIFLFIEVFFAIYNFIVTNNYNLVIVHIFGIIGVIVTLLLLNNKPNLKYASYTFVTLIFLIVVSFSIFSVKENYSLIWTLAFPLMSFYLLGSKQGAIVTLIYLIVIFAYCYSISPHTLSSKALINIYLELTMMSLVLFAYEFSREKIFIQLNKVIKIQTQQAHEMYKLSTTDSLTQLYNRQKIDTIFTTSVNEALKNHTPITIMMIDIDHFKKINDTYGHQVGDMVLVKFADVLRAQLHHTFIGGRWGGEEFLIISYEIKSETLKLAQKLQNKIAQEITHFDYPFTVSIGIAQLTLETQDELLKRADRALYKAKLSGRNAIEVD